MQQMPVRGFAAPTGSGSQPVDQDMSGSSQKRITPRSLCEITGTKYYIHNEEIGYNADKKVRVYDENDQLIGDLTFQEALTSAHSAKKDLVLRNDKSDPPVCKIMLYKMELLKKLFKKLGKQHTEEKEQKSKTIRLTTTIAMHDLENKKRKAVEYLKTVSNLKFYIKVNIYDEENVQKGRLMLMNIAEDLKEYAKIKVSPMQEPAGAAEKLQPEPKMSSKKGANVDDFKKQADQSRQRKGEMQTTDDTPVDDEGEFLDGLQNYIFMELQSTVAFKEIDIDQMLQHTTLDDFLRGLYVKAVDAGNGAAAGGRMSQHDKLMA